MKIVFFIACITMLYSAHAQHPNAHAHNDYEHVRPLYDALAHGFTSVEVDVHLVEDQLWVSHNRPTPSSPTLETLYLKPLAQLIKEQGAVYSGYSGDFLLMIDIKTDANPTYEALEKLLFGYTELIDTPLNTTDDDHAVKIFLSGIRAMKAVLESKDPLVSLDGRPEDLDEHILSTLMPVVSERFSKYNPYTLSGKVNPAKESKLKSHIKAVHQQGKKVRFWAHPDDKATWDYLLSLGVDLINSDKLEELDSFLTSKGL